MQIDIVMRIACWSWELILWWASLADRDQDWGRGRDRNGDGGGGGNGDRGRDRDREIFLLCFLLLNEYLCEWNYNCKINFQMFFYIFCMDSRASGSEARQFQKNEIPSNLKRGLGKSISKFENSDFCWKIAFFAIKNKKSVKNAILFAYYYY